MYQVNDHADTQIQIPINLASGKAPAELQAAALGRQVGGGLAAPRSRASSGESTRSLSASPGSASSAGDSEETGFSDLSQLSRANELADRPAQARHARYRLEAAKASYSDAQDKLAKAVMNSTPGADTSGEESYYDAAAQELQSATEDSFMADMLNPEMPVDVGTVKVPAQKPVRSTASSVSRRAASPAPRSAAEPAAEQADSASLNQLRAVKINSILDEVYKNFNDAIFAPKAQSLKGQPGYGYFEANDGSRWYFKTSMIPVGKSLATVTHQDLFYDASGNPQNKFERVAFPKPDSSVVTFKPDGSYGMDVFGADNRTVSASYNVSADGRTLPEASARAGASTTARSTASVVSGKADLSSLDTFTSQTIDNAVYFTVYDLLSRQGEPTDIAAKLVQVLNLKPGSYDSLVRAVREVQNAVAAGDKTAGSYQRFKSKLDTLRSEPVVLQAPGEAEARAALNPTPAQAARVAADPQLSYQDVNVAHSALGVTPGTQPSQANLEKATAAKIKATPAKTSFFRKALAILKRYFGYA